MVVPRCAALLLNAMVLLLALPTESRAFASNRGGCVASSSSKASSSGAYPVSSTVDVVHNRRKRDERDATSRSSLVRLRAGGGDDVGPSYASSASYKKSSAASPPDPPTNYQIAKFYLPCLALWISGPLLSLVDTSFVGLSAKSGIGAGFASSASQLAALGPATTFIDGSLYLFAFLNVATTNLYASALASSGKVAGDGTGRRNGMGNDELPGEGVVRTAAKTSLYSGIGLMLLLLAVARPLIALYIGELSDKK